MRKILVLSTFILVLLSGVNVLCKPGNTETDKVKDAQLTDKHQLTIYFEPGKAYSHTKWMFIIPIKLTPQMAFWIEDSNGELVTTIYLTKKAAKNSWMGAAEERPEALPVFTTCRNNSPLKKRSVADTISGATPKAHNNDIHAMGISGLEYGQTYTVYAEINSSFDYNSEYNKKNSGVNGQPSLIYKADFIYRNKTEALENGIRLKPIGTGSVEGLDGKIYDKLSTLTNALQILDKIYIKKYN